MTTQTQWIAAAQDELLGLRGRGNGWGYRQGSPPCSEPTALAALALLATSHDEQPCRDAAAWLAQVQQPDGSIGVSATVSKPGWMTPYAVLLWSALQGWDSERAKAVEWLDSIKGETVDPMDNLDHVAGHDTTLVGWPWVAKTHSWLEPTALAVLALTNEAADPTRSRVKEATILIRDRAVKTGGWNYGNKAVFGKDLRPQPAPTGIALLALAGTGRNDRMIQAGTRYLRETLPSTRAAASLGWGLLGLKAWDIEPSEALLWLAESHGKVTGRPDAAVKLSYLLLGSTAASLKLFHRAKGAVDGIQSLAG